MKLAGVLALGLVAAYAFSITPAMHDYGQTSLGDTASTSFDIRFPPGARPGDTVALILQGTHPIDFVLPSPLNLVAGSPACPGSPSSYLCTLDVGFSPRSLGHKTAILVAFDKLGNRATAQLKGEGVGAGCIMRVVPCNYAWQYSGVFTWTFTVNSPGTQSFVNVQVNVIDGVATCTGSDRETELGRTRTGVTLGPGLIAVEFLNHRPDPLVYLISASCPSPDFPATATEPAMPSQPADMGGMFTSEKQPARLIGMNLAGSISYPAAETDPVNAVTGVVQVSWLLCRGHLPCTPPAKPKPPRPPPPPPSPSPPPGY